jgi:hypothetical protein
MAVEEGVGPAAWAICAGFAPNNASSRIKTVAIKTVVMDVRLLVMALLLFCNRGASLGINWDNDPS